MKNIEIGYYKKHGFDLILGTYDGKLCLANHRDKKTMHQVDKRLQKALNATYVEKENTLIVQTKKELDAYFAGQRDTFDLPLLLVGSDFQKSVWHALLTIPYGKTMSYKEQATRIGKPKAVRAVANANGANAISIIVPCHRVIGANGTLTGYAGGIERKKILLDLEKKFV